MKSILKTCNIRFGAKATYGDIALPSGGASPQNMLHFVVSAYIRLDSLGS